MKYLEFTFRTSPCTEVVNDVLSAILGDAGFESFVEQEGGIAAYIQKDLYDETYPFDGYKMPEKSVRDIWLSTDEIKAIRDVKVSRENRIRKYLRNLYMFIHFIYLIFFYYFCSK